MKKISQMSLPELRTLALETDKLDVLWDIMTNCKDDPCTIQNIVSNPLTRFNAKLVRMAYDKGDTRVQITIARHTVDSSIIDDAACSDNRSVRANAALNPNINLPTLIRLSQDSWWGVRASLLSNEKITREFVRTIYDNDSDFTIRTLARELLDKMAPF